MRGISKTLIGAMVRPRPGNLTLPSFLSPSALDPVNLRITSDPTDWATRPSSDAFQRQATLPPISLGGWLQGTAGNLAILTQNITYSKGK